MWGYDMISLTRINGTMIVINAEIIEFVEANPDTIVSLMNGHKYLVKDSVDDVVKKVRDYKHSVLRSMLTEDQ